MFLSGIGVESMDCVAQANLGLDIFSQFPNIFREAMSQFGIHDAFVHSNDFMILIFQNTLFQPVVIRSSSIESYDVQMQESLFNWSEQEVSKWI